jgi:anaerobic selenocysteine-containing dehydrogenase
LTVTTDAGRVVEVNGDRRGPLTEGFICGKVRKIADHLYGEDRVLYPMVRERGELRRASWDAALDLVADKLREIRARTGGEAILPYHYGGSNGYLTEGALADRLFRRLGASKLARTFCAAATTAAQTGLYGSLPGVALEDYIHSKLIVLWGVNPSATSIHLVPVIERAREAGAKLVVIDPRRTPLARRADLHLAVRPGTDLPVALAVIHALFDRGHADSTFLEHHAAEVDELAHRASRWSIEAAAREAEIAPSELDRFVELYAASSPAVVRCGWGVERNRNGGSAVAAILAIPAVGGKFGVRGGGFTMSNGDAAGWQLADHNIVAERAPATRTVNMSELGTALRTLREPRIECLFVYNCNPVATAPDQRAVLAELARDDLFVIVHDQVMTDTARVADVVLPATAFLEHREVRRGYGTMRLFDSPAVATPAGEARSNNQLFGALLDRLGLARPGEPTTDDELVAALLASSPHAGALRSELAERGMAEPPLGARPVAFVDVFPGTVAGRIHLVPAHLDRDAKGLYAYKPDPRDTEFPLSLISPALATQISSTFGQLRTAPAAIEIAVGDAAARGITDGDPVRVWNALGEVRCVAKVSRDVRDGVCVLPKGLWRKHTRNGFTANALIPAGFADLGGQAAYNDARVQIERDG